MESRGTEPAVRFIPSFGLPFPALVVIWLICLVIPALFLKEAALRLIRYGETLLENQAQQTLFHEMEDFHEDLKIKNQIWQDFRRFSQKFRLILDDPKLRYSLEKGVDPGIIRENLPETIRQAFQESMGLEPLTIFAAGCDLKDTVVAADPKYFPPGRQPSRILANLLLTQFADLPSRRSWAYPDVIGKAREKWKDPDKLLKSAENVSQQLFGTYVRPPFQPDDVREYYSEKFGEGNLFVYAQLITADASPDSPVLGALLVTFLEKSLPLRSFLEKARRSAHRKQVKRSYHWFRGDPYFRDLPRFFQKGNRLIFFSPMKLKSANIAFKDKQSFYRTLAPTRQPGIGNRFPGLSTSMHTSAFQHPLRPFLPWIELITWLFIITSGVFLLKYGFFSQPVPLNLRWKLFVAVTAAVFVPLIAFWLASQAYLQFHQKFERRQILGRLASDLKRFEDNLNGFNSVILGDIWKFKRTMEKVVDSSEAGIRTLLEGWPRIKAAEGAFFLRSDGLTYASGSLNPNPTPDSIVKMPRESLKILLGEAVIQVLSPLYSIRDSDLFYLKLMDFLAVLEKKHGPDPFLRAWVKSEYSDVDRFRHKLHSTGVNDGKLLTGKISTIQNFKLCYVKIAPEKSLKQSFHGLLVILFPFEKIGDLFFSEAMSNFSNFEKHEEGYHLRYSFYKTDIDKTVIRPSQGYSRPDPDLMQLARKVLRSQKDRIWEAGEKEHPTFLIGKIFLGFPYIGVGIAEPEQVTTQRFLGTTFSQILVGYTLLSVLLITGFLARIFLDPFETLTRGIELINEGRYGVKMSIYSGDEFSLLSGGFNEMSQGLLERERMARFVPSEVIEEIQTGMEDPLNPIGERIQVAILFSDIRSFTTISEQNSAPDVVSLLNSYFSAMEPAIDTFHGTINKFIGDAIMAVFYQVKGLEPPALRACRAGLEMRSRLRYFNKERERGGWFEIDNGIGVALGMVVSGKIGSTLGRLDFTVVGDTVQAAGNLESASKLGKASKVVVSPDVIKEIRGFLRFSEIAPEIFELEDSA